MTKGWFTSFHSLPTRFRAHQTMTKSKRIVLWGLEDLLSSSVESYLSHQEGWQVVNISDEKDFEALIQEIDRLHADIVIIPYPDLVGIADMPLKIFHRHPKVKVITVNLQNNILEVFGKQKIMITAASDLISVIEGDLVAKKQQEK
jgi:DNA-binding NarL/FixJ family response regulator